MTDLRLNFPPPTDREIERQRACIEAQILEEIPLCIAVLCTIIIITVGAMATRSLPPLYAALSVMSLMLFVVGGVFVAAEMSGLFRYALGIHTDFNAIQDAPRGAGRMLDTWCQNAMVRRYCDAVRTQGRWYTQGEIDALHAHWEASADAAPRPPHQTKEWNNEIRDF